MRYAPTGLKAGARQSRCPYRIAQETNKRQGQETNELSIICYSSNYQLLVIHQKTH
jgi:hypothetical protein